MYNIHLHKDARKGVRKFQKPIRKKVLKALDFLRTSGTQDFPFPIDSMKGKFKKFKYFEIKISKDCRILYRKKDNEFFIRKIGTHEDLGTG